MKSTSTDFDVIVVGGGPAGATAAKHLANQGIAVALLDKPGRIKPCGGAVPPRLIQDFDIPDSQIVSKANCARMISPLNQQVDMPIDGGYVGMVNRDQFDEWLRERARQYSATRIDAKFIALDASDDKQVRVSYRLSKKGSQPTDHTITGKVVIGADGANSAVGKGTVKGADKIPFVAAYHEIVKSPAANKPPEASAKAGSPGAALTEFDPKRCDVYYQGRISPDFYGWVFPHGDETSIGVGSAVKGFSLRNATASLRTASGMSDAETIRREGAPIPLKALKRWDNGRNVILAGDAAGVVAPASGEGIYYAMRSGQVVAEAVEEMLLTSDPGSLKAARKRFMHENGKVLFILGIMQKFWYSSDKRREKFVHICRDEDVQKLTWEAYMNKKLSRRKPVAHLRIFFKDLAHLFGFLSVPKSR